MRRLLVLAFAWLAVGACQCHQARRCLSSTECGTDGECLGGYCALGLDAVGGGVAGGGAANGGGGAPETVGGGSVVTGGGSAGGGSAGGGSAGGGSAGGGSAGGGSVVTGGGSAGGGFVAIDGGVVSVCNSTLRSTPVATLASGEQVLLAANSPVTVWLAGQLNQTVRFHHMDTTGFSLHGDSSCGGMPTAIGWSRDDGRLYFVPVGSAVVRQTDYANEACSVFPGVTLGGTPTAMTGSRRNSNTNLYLLMGSRVQIITETPGSTSSNVVQLGDGGLTLNAAHGTPDGQRMFFVGRQGDDGVIIGRGNAGNFQMPLLFGNAPLTSVSVFDDNNAVAVGGKKVFSYNGTTWNGSTDAPFELVLVQQVASNELIGFGAKGGVARNRNGIWSTTRPDDGPVRTKLLSARAPCAFLVFDALTGLEVAP